MSIYNDILKLYLEKLKEEGLDEEVIEVLKNLLDNDSFSSEKLKSELNGVLSDSNW